MKSAFRIMTMAFAILMISVSLHAQDPLTKEITVVAPYEPSISEAYKIRLIPKFSDTVSLKKQFNYEIISTYLPVSYAINPLKPANIAGEPLRELYRNYIRAGMGTYTTPYLEYFYNSGRDKRISYGIHLKHLSSWGEIRDYANSGYSNNTLGGYFRTNHKKSGNGFMAKADFVRNVHHFYGFRPADFDSVPAKDDLRQRFNYLDASLEYFSQHNREKKLKFHHYLNFTNVSDIFKNGEFSAKAGTRLSRDSRFTHLTESQTLNLDAIVELYKNRVLDSAMPGLGFITLKPFISTEFNEFSLRFGVRADIRIDSSARAWFFPEADFGIRILEDKMSLRFGVTGGLRHINLYELTRSNPYIADDIDLLDQIIKYRMFLEFKGRLGNRTDFNLVFSTSGVEGAEFFVTDTAYLYRNRFTLVHDDLNILEAKAELGYQAGERFLLGYSLLFREYSLADFTPWHEPAFRTALSAIYNFRNKIILNGEFYFTGKRFARDFDTEGDVMDIQLDAFTDLNLEVEYRYTRLLSAFLRFNNILGQNYQLWYGYPVQGFSFMGGLTYSF